MVPFNQSPQILELLVMMKSALAHQRRVDASSKASDLPGPSRFSLVQLFNGPLTLRHPFQNGGPASN